MEIQINGEPFEAANGSTVASLLRQVGVEPADRGLAVALNAAVVTRDRWEETLLRDGDRVEVIRPTQGG